MIDRPDRTRLPLTSRVWFFPTLILLTPLLSRACMVGMSSKPRPAAPSNEEVCLSQYDECIALCEGDTETDTGDTETGDTDTGDTETGDTETDTGGESDCVQVCEAELQDCFEFGAVSPPADYQSGGPTCDPGSGYCGYDDSPTPDYGEPVEEDSESYDWSCDSSDDDYYDDDSSSGFSCDYSDEDSSDDYSDDGSGFDCSADNYDEGDSDDDGDDWGEDWGERSPAGGDGIEAPTDLPAP